MSIRQRLENRRRQYFSPDPSEQISLGSKECFFCDGQGIIDDVECPKCDGEGRVDRDWDDEEDEYLSERESMRD